MTRAAYLDIIGGISGDMLLAAMLDAGLDKELLEQELTRIVPNHFQLITTKTTRGAIKATHIEVNLGNDSARRLNWNDFNRSIETSDLPETDLAKIRTIFDHLQNAEAQAHHASPGSTHLHELGTFDTLIDIAGAVIGLRLLNIDSLHASPLPASTGMSSSSHGKNASIAPATMAIIKNHQIPVRISATHPPAGESITPTGAAIIASLAQFTPSNMTIETVGYGAGTRNSDSPPNVVGIWLGQSTDQTASIEQTAANIGLKHQSDVVLIETNLDDMTGEEIGHAIQVLFNNGALDVWTTPIQMKKNRPGVTLSAIASKGDLGSISAAFFTHTSTLGVRVRQLDRLVADRETIKVETEYGPIRVKLRKIDGKVTQIAPEYDDCARIASSLDLPIGRISDTAKQAASESIANFRTSREH